MSVDKADTLAEESSLRDEAQNFIVLCDHCGGQLRQQFKGDCPIG